MELLTAAAYIRVSTNEQTEFSPDAQLRELREYAISHNMILSEKYVYADEGISGRKAEKRPAFLKMIQDAKDPSHPFDVILVHKFDRFARNREDSVVYKAILKRAGVEVVSIKEPLAEGSYSGVMEAIYEAFAEAYSLNLGQEVKKGMTEKALRGEFQTAPPYGYMLGSKTSSDRALIPQPEEAEYVREIFRRFVSGEGYFSIASWLNACNQRTHRGNAFENRTIEYIIRNPIYIAKTRWNPSGRTRRHYSDPNIIVADASHEALISDELWEAAQSRVAEIKARWRWHGRPAGARHHWLCGIVRCAACGATLIWAKPHYLKCNNYSRGRCKHSQHIAVEIIEKALIETIRSHIANQSNYDVRVLNNHTETDAELRLLRQQQASNSKKKDRLLDAYLSGADISIAKYNEIMASLKAEESQIKQRLSEIETHDDVSKKNINAKLVAEIETAIKTLELPSATMEQKHDAADALIESCLFDKDSFTLTVTYRIEL